MSLKFGIICTNKDVGFCLFKRPKSRDVKVEDFEATVLCLPYTIEQISCMSSAKLRRIILRAASVLRRVGICKAVVSREIKSEIKKKVKEIFGASSNLKGFRIISGERMFLKLIPDSVKRIIQSYGDDLNTEIGVSECMLSSTTENIIRELCYCSNRINLYTRYTRQAEALYDRVMYEYGIMLRLFTWGMPVKDDIFINIDKLEIVVGRERIINDIELELYQNEYQIDTLDLAACVGEKAKIKNFISKQCDN